LPTASSTDPRHTISAVQVESGLAFDGATVARIRMTLSQAMRPAGAQLSQRHLCRDRSAAIA
jgi:hypothetical protein